MVCGRRLSSLRFLSGHCALKGSQSLSAAPQSLCITDALWLCSWAGLSHGLAYQGVTNSMGGRSEEEGSVGKWGVGRSSKKN